MHSPSCGAPLLSPSPFTDRADTGGRRRLALRCPNERDRHPPRSATFVALTDLRTPMLVSWTAVLTRHTHINRRDTLHAGTSPIGPTIRDGTWRLRVFGVSGGRGHRPLSRLRRRPGPDPVGRYRR